MSDYEFTEEERKMIYLYSRKRSSLLDTFSYYGVYVLPSLLFAAYSLWKHDFIAALTAYTALFIVAVLYLSKSGEYGVTLASICKKADAMEKALNKESDS